MICQCCGVAVSNNSEECPLCGAPIPAQDSSPRSQDGSSGKEDGDAPKNTEDVEGKLTMCASLLKAGLLPGEIASKLGERYYDSCFWKNGVLGTILNMLLCWLVSWVVDQASEALSLSVSYLVGLIVLMMQLYFAAKKAGSVGVKKACWGIVVTIVVLGVVLGIVAGLSGGASHSRSYYY